MVEFSKQGRELLQVGQATLMKSKETGRMIPKLIGLDGRIIESGKEVGKLSSVAGKVASLSSIIIGAAHIISGADVAKKVAQVGRDVQFLVQARQNEQVAKLEAIYHWLSKFWLGLYLNMPGGNFAGRCAKLPRCARHGGVTWKQNWSVLMTRTLSDSFIII